MYEWPLLTQKEWKIYQIFVHYNQHSRVLRVAKLMPLNMQTCVKVCGIVIWIDATLSEILLNLLRQSLFLTLTGIQGDLFI